MLARIGWRLEGEDSVAVATLLTADDLLKLPPFEGRHELVQGELIEMSPSAPFHSEIGVEIAYQIRSYLERENLGRVYGADMGYILSREPDTVRSPDVSVVLTARLPAGRSPTEGFLSAAPDLAVEVLSPNDRPGYVQAKVSDYLTAGTALVWVVDPERRKVTVYDGEGGVQVLGEDQQLDGGAVLPGFSVRVRQFFP